MLKKFLLIFVCIKRNHYNVSFIKRTSNNLFINLITTISVDKSITNQLICLNGIYCCVALRVFLNQCQTAIFRID